jgi:hypothetical protein
MDFIPSPANAGLNWFVMYIVYGILKSDNSQDYAQKSQQNCSFMNSASDGVLRRGNDVKMQPLPRGAGQGEG